MLLCLLSAGIADAQEKIPQVVKSEPQLEDIYTVLETMDIYLFRFDLKQFLNQTYTVNVYVDEYEKGKAPKQAHLVGLGKNILSLDVVPEEEREAFRQIKRVPEGKNEWEEIKEMSLYLRKSNDSTAICTVNVPESRRGGTSLKLKPIEKYGSYIYFPRPFKLQETKETEKGHFKIPLLLYGSAWLDKKYEIIRFCGEKEIDPEMKAKILEDLPHYYVIGIEFKKEGDGLE